MASEPEPEVVLPIGAQKHDPAWKHCLMVRSAGRVRLKCMYCHKHFLGGGIHHFKEHLARRPDNACCCPKVPCEDQETMLHSLNTVAAKKKRKQSLADDIRRISHPAASPTRRPLPLAPTAAPALPRSTALVAAPRWRAPST